MLQQPKPKLSDAYQAQNVVLKSLVSTGYALVHVIVDQMLTVVLLGTIRCVIVDLDILVIRSMVALKVSLVPELGNTLTRIGH